MKKMVLFFGILSFVFLFAKSALAFNREIADIPQSLLVAEWALEILILALVGGIIYSIIRVIQLYGGLIGSSFKILGIGVFFLALETINRVLESFGLNFIENRLGVGGKEILFVGLKAVALFILAIGFQNLTTIFQKSPQKK